MTHRKHILDSTQYRNKPMPLALTSGKPFAFAPTNGYYQTRELVLDVDDTILKETDTGLPCESGCRYLVRWALRQGAKYLILGAEGEQSKLPNLKQALKWVRAEIAKQRASLKVSCFTVDADARYYTERYVNGRLRPEWVKFMNTLDFVTPCFYGYQDLMVPKNMQDWITGTVKAVTATRAVTGKPIYPFVSGRYWDTPGISGAFIPAEPFRAMVTTLMSVADGFTVWDPGCSLQGPEVAGDWDDSAPWWQIVRGG